MKKLLAIFFILATALLSVSHGVLAYSMAMQGTNLLADGDMEAAGVASWQYLPDRVTVSKVSVSPYSGKQNIKILRIGAIDFNWIYQPIFTPLHTYRCTGWAKGTGENAEASLGGAGGATVIVATDGAGWKHFDITHTLEAGRDTLYLGQSSAAVGGITEWDDVSCIEVKGKIQNQDKQLLADGDMEAATTAAWNSTGGATLSKQTSSPHGGNRVLRVAGVQGEAAYENIMVTGKKYRVTGFGRGSGTGGQPNVGGSIGGAPTFTTSHSWQRFDFIGTAVGSSLGLYQQAVGGDYAEYDDITVTEYNGIVQNQSKQLLSDGDMEATNAAVALVDGDMEAAAATTTDGGAWTSYQVFLSKSTASPHSGARALRLSFDGTNTFGEAYQTNLTSGHTYHLTAWMRGDGTINPVISDTAGTWVNGTSTTTWQAVDVTKVMTGTFFNFASAFLSAGHWVEFDDITITDVTAGNWPSTNGLISKETTSPHGGAQLVRIAYDGSHTIGWITQTVLTAGKTYRATGWARGDGTSIPRAMVGGGTYNWIGTASNSWQRFDFTATADGIYFLLRSENLSAGHYVEFDDVQVTLDQ